MRGAERRAYGAGESDCSGGIAPLVSEGLDSLVSVGDVSGLEGFILVAAHVYSN